MVIVTKKYVSYVVREIWFNILTKIISDIAIYPCSKYISVTTKEVILIDLNFDVSTESSNFDSGIPIAAALVNLAMCLSSSIFGNKLLILRWRKCSPLCLKIFHSFWSNGWRLWKGPGLRLISPESNSSNRWYELELQYISCETDRKTDCECKWEVYRDSNLLINSMVKKCDRLQKSISWWGVGCWRCLT